jgi:hypothetical protein
VAIGLGVAVVVLLASLGAALYRGGPKTPPEVAVVATATATAVPMGPASAVPTATASSGPGAGASAAPSAPVDAGVAKVPGVPHGPGTGPKKKDPMQRE